MSKRNKLGKVHPPRQAILARHESFSGPLPAPVDLEHYEKVLPGAAERIISMAERQSAHRQNLETKVINSEISNSKTGLYFGFAIGIGGFIVVGYCASFGYQILAGIIAALDIGSLVGVFVYGSEKRKKERIEKEHIVSME